MKNCSKCKQTLSINLFAPNKNVKSGLASWCRCCVSEYNKSEKNKVKARKRSKKHRINNGLITPSLRTLEKKDIELGLSGCLTCSNCKIKKESSCFTPAKNIFSSWCKVCQSANSKKRRKEKRKSLPFSRFDRWSKDDKYRARMKVNNALSAGKIKKLNCVICDSSESQAHHEDYDKHLHVIWLCSHHHAEVHKMGLSALGL